MNLNQFLLKVDTSFISCGPYDCIYQLKIMSTHKLSELIKMLQKSFIEHGDMDVVYHDQEMACVMNPKDLTTVSDGKLFFGGFHVNGESFSDLGDIWLCNAKSDAKT